MLSAEAQVEPPGHQQGSHWRRLQPEVCMLTNASVGGRWPPAALLVQPA